MQEPLSEQVSEQMPEQVPEQVPKQVPERDSSANLSSKLPGTLSGASLRSRLLQTILPVVLLPMIVASAVGYRMIAQRTESRVQQQLADQSLLASEGTTAVLNDLLDLPRSIADSPLVVNEAKIGSQEATSAGLNQRPIDQLEVDFAEFKLLRQHSALNTYLEKTVETAELSEISITDSHGFNVAYSHPTTDFVQSDEAWWQNGKANQQWIGPPEFDYASKGFTVELVQAIRDPLDDSFVGMVRAVLPTRKFSLLADHLKRTGITGSQRVQLVDGGTMKTIDTFSAQGFYKDREIIGAQPVEQAIAAFVTATKGDTSAEKVLAALNSKATGAEQISLPFFDENAQMASFVSQKRQYKMAKVPNSNWVAIASMDEIEIAAAGRDSLRFLGLFTLLLAALTTGIIFWLSRQLSGPLRRLTKQAEGLAAGNFDLAIAPAGTTETQFLTQTFNQLAIKVKELLNEQRTETRKAELFAYVTGSAVTALPQLEPLVERSVQSALDILKVDRVTFYPVSADLAVSNGRMILRSRLVERHLPENNLGLAHWLPTDSSLASGMTELPSASQSADSGHLNGRASEQVNAQTASQASEQVREQASSQAKDQAIILNDTATANVDERHRKFLSNMSVRSSLSVPVFGEVEASEPQLLGYFIAHHCHSAHVWQADEVGFLQQLAAQLKLVVDRITATENIRRSRFETHSSRQAAQKSQARAEAIAQQQYRRATALRRQEESLQRQIAVLAREIEGASQGDLTVRAQVSEGKLKTVASIFNATVANLEELVTQIKRSTSQVDAVFTQNGRAAVNLTEVARQQTQDASKALQTLKGVYASMNNVVDIAQAASEGARQVAEKAEAGEAAINQTSAKIQALNHTAANAVAQIGQLARSAQNVSYMTTMISEIAAEMKLISDQNLYEEEEQNGASIGLNAGSSTGSNNGSNNGSNTRTALRSDMRSDMKLGLRDRTREMSKAMASMAKLSERAVSEAAIIDTFLTSAQHVSEQIAQAMVQINQQVADSNNSVVSSQQNLSEVLAIARQFEHVAQSVSEAVKTQPQVTQTATKLIESAVDLSAKTTQVSEEMAQSLQKAVETTQDLQSSISIFKVSS